MPTRRQEILDAAIDVLGAEGPRGLTHRAVDKRLHLPLGSTANVYGRRAELLAGIVERMEELDRAQWEHLHHRRAAESTQELARSLTEFVYAAASAPMAQMQKARYYLQLALPEETAATRERIGNDLKQVMTAAGTPPQRADVVLATIDGLMIRAITYGTAALPCQAAIEESLRQLMTSA